jgi:hypothetical protein
LLRLQVRRGDPGGDRIARLLRELKLDRPLCFPLHDNGAGSNVTTPDHIVNAEADQITPRNLLSMAALNSASSRVR